MPSSVDSTKMEWASSFSSVLRGEKELKEEEGNKERRKGGKGGEHKKRNVICRKISIRLVNLVGRRCESRKMELQRSFFPPLQFLALSLSLYSASGK